ncbi:uncharacterized protein LOC129602493 isoform X3 [Paramacrobiotus metropolitanus]|nr:uncharacterized protein LOC129602493 isoform X3 [Paramacrobiotus metropolitanus]
MVNLQEAAAAVGLRLNTAKCELFVDGGTPAERENVAQLFLNAVPDIRISKPEELELLGSPLLSEAIAGALMRKVGQAQVLADQLGILPSHQAFFLLKNCLSLPKLLYILRTSPCWQYPEELRKFDDVIRFKAEQLTNVAMSDTVWNQASLPTKFGGLGLISATEVALAAYTSSVHGAVDMVCNVTRNESIKDRCNRLIEVWTSRFSTEPPRTESRRFQSAWTTPQHTQTASRMMENADVITSARLLAASSSESRAWLSALPVSLFGNLLEDAHLRIAVARRLGAPVCEQHVCRCGNVVDSLGHHGLVCKLAKGRHGVHAVLNDVTKRALNSARMPSSLEPPGLDRGDGKRPDGVTVFPWKNGKPLVWDVTVADTFAQTYIARTSRVPGSAAEARENHKLGKYDGLADRYVVQPIAFETTGTFGPLTKKFFKELSRKISDCTGETGVGKSTWINGIINYLTYGELGDAKKGKLKCWIPFEFMKTSSNFDQTKVRMEANIGNTGTEDEFVAENVGVDGSSVTQEPRSFAFPYGDGIIRLIDTPGVGDTRGYEQDRLNFGKVLGHIAFLSEIHGICILLKPNNSRLTVTFQFCINELLTHLHKDAAENIIFVFTNSRSTSYLPGDTLPPLKTLLQNKPDLSIHLSLHTMYCMDNEAVRFLAAAENGISFTEKEEEDFAESWKTSVGETRRLLDHIFSLPPHNTRNTVTLNEARRLVLQFTEPLGKISTLLENNVELIKSKREDLQRQIADKTVLEKDLYVPVQRLHVKSSSVPRTVCAAAKCIEVLRDENGETKINYKTVCHENCTLKEVPPEVATQDKLRRCNAMRWFTQNCSRCGCNYKEHMHIHYECFKKDEKVVDVSVRSLLDAQSGIIRAAEETLKRLEEAEKELLREKKIITRASSKFACFLKAKSMVPYNDALEDYLDFLIKKAEQSLGLLKDGATDSDRKRLAACKRMRESYKEERDLMERARSQGATDADITAEGMRKEIEQLYALKNFGQNFRDMVRFENTNELDRSRYRETLHGAECNFSKKPNSLQKRAKQEYKALKNKGKETMKSLHLLPGSRH